MQSWPRRVIASRTRLYVVLLIVILVGAERVHEYVQSQAIRQRLVGRWTFARDESPIDNHILVFRPDGMVCIYPFGRPEAATENIAGDMEWEVSGGELVLTHDRLYFTRNATFGQKLVQLNNLIADRIRGKHDPISYSQRYLIGASVGNTIALTPHPEAHPHISSKEQSFTLTRATADTSPQPIPDLPKD